MKLQTRLVAVAIGSVSTVACGASGTSDQDQITQVIVDVNNELVSCMGDAECDPSVFDEYATGTARENLEGVISGMFGATIDADIKVTVGEVTVDGDNATTDACSVITINGAAQNGEPIDVAQLGDLETWVKQSYELNKVDSTWKVNANEQIDNGPVEAGTDPCAV